jgi:protein TonB
MDLLQPVLQPQRHQAFKLMVVLSVLLHMAVFAALTSRTPRQMGGKKIAFIDLTMSAPAASPATHPHLSAESHPAVTQKVPPPKAPAPTQFADLQDKIEKNLQAPDNGTAIQQTSVGLGATRGYFRSLGEGETLRADIQAYYFDLLQSINEKWWLDKNIDRKGIRELVMNVLVARDGTIIGKELVRGSGNSGYDRAVLKALEGVGHVPPLPETYRGDYFIAPIRLVAPLNLLAS